MDCILSLPPSFQYSYEPIHSTPQYPSSTMCNFALIENSFIFKQYSPLGFIPFFSLPKGHIQSMRQVQYEEPFYVFSVLLKSGLVFQLTTNIQLPPFFFHMPRQLLAQPVYCSYDFELDRYFNIMGIGVQVEENGRTIIVQSKRDQIQVVQLKSPELKEHKFNCANRSLRVLTENQDFSICATYPRYIIIPAGVTTEKLRGSAKFRSSSRFPALSLLYNNNMLYRAAQPNFGIFGSNSYYQRADSDLVEAIAEELIIVDCRPYINVLANALTGKGVEKHRMYRNVIKIEFLGLQNIHALRKAWYDISGYFQQYCIAQTQQIQVLGKDVPVSFLAQQVDDKQFLQLKTIFADIEALRQCTWQRELENLLAGARGVQLKLRNQSVLLHCSDGWDRTAQVAAITAVLCYAHYRTVQGFLDVIYREFFDFGHRIGTRGGNLAYSSDEKQISPVFILFLDAIRQLVKWNKGKFAFGEKLLLYLAYQYRALEKCGFQSDCARDRAIQGEKMEVFGYVIDNIKEFETKDQNIQGELIFGELDIWWRYWSGGGW